jgi:hypothetical protein
MQRLLALVTALALLMALPAAASAARPTRITDHFVGISCDGMTAETGGGFIFFGASVSDQFGPDGFVDYWTESEPTDAPDLFRDFEQPVDVTWDGTTISGSIPLMDGDGNPADPATFSATLVVSGDPFTIDDSFRDGNTQHRVTGLSQPMDPSGTLLIDGSSFSLDGCFAEDATLTFFDTNPTAFAVHFSDRFVDCQLTNVDGDTGFLFTSLNEDHVFVDTGATSADGLTSIGGFADGALVGGVLDAALETYDPNSGEPLPAGGSIHLEIVGSGDPIDYMLKYATGREVARGTTLDIEGTLTLGTMVFDLGACVGIDIRGKFIDTFPRGPKPGGKVPSNDLPGGAKLLVVGDRTSVATKGASPAFEEPFECLTFEEGGEVFEVPVGSTVWYRIVGTGDPVTIDTAGSDYDTVIAVYTSDGAGGFDPVPGACVDDVPVQPLGRTLQAAVTFDTIAGTTYYVQIGGYPQSFTYGNLRVAVR